MQKSFGNCWSRIELLCIFLALLAPRCVLSLSSNRIKINSIKVDESHQILNVIELINERDILERDVITYQQQQQTRELPESAKDIRILEIKSEGFDNALADDLPTYLYVTPFKDSCRKNASFLPSWKINNGTSNGVLRIKINYEQRLTDGVLYFCVSDSNNDDNANWRHHLGDSSGFQLRR